MADEQVHLDALALANAMLADAEIEEVESANSFVVLTTNDETHKIHLNGPFPDAASALAWAEPFEADVNKGLAPDDAPYRVTVYPVVSPA